MPDGPDGRNTPPLHTPSQPACSPSPGTERDRRADRTPRARSCASEPLAHMDIRRRLVRLRIGFHPDRIVGARHGHVADIGGENQCLSPAFAFRIQQHRDKGRILHDDPHLLGRRHQDESHPGLCAGSSRTAAPAPCGRWACPDETRCRRGRCGCRYRRNGAGCHFSTGGRPRQLAASRWRLASPIERWPIRKSAEFSSLPI